MKERRVVLQEVKSGLIESVSDGILTRIEFNCDCLDALSVCHGLCCRMRSGYSVELEADELDRYHSRPHPSRLGVTILAAKKDSLSCIYLDEEKSICTIHERRPKMCQRWHCSPQGQMGDKAIEVRDAGWVLVPLRYQEVEAIRQGVEKSRMHPKEE